MYPRRPTRQSLVTSVLAAAAVATACASGYTGAAPIDPPRRTAGAPVDVMARSFDMRAFATDPYRPLVDVITRYWPNVTNPPWRLRTAFPSELDPIGVYANGLLLGGLDAIRDIPAGWAAKVRRLTPSEERMAFGHQHVAGALVIDWVKR